jgi:lipopolysaccharide biosynthesis glycosyltransferase
MNPRNAIVLTSDAKIFPAAAFVADRLAALNTRADTDVFVFTESERDMADAAAFGARFEVRRIDAALVRAFPESGHVTRAAYYWFFAPGLLGEQYRRILYLDVDTYPESDKLLALFDLDMQEHAFAAVRGLRHTKGTRETRLVLRKGGGKYLNSGVLLIDRARYIETGLFEQLIDVARGRTVPLGLWDQSALNYVLDGDWLELSPSFNMVVAMWNSPVRKAFEPVIVHFAGPVKPWHGARFQVDHPVRRELERFVLASPWKGFLASHYGLDDVLRALDSRPASDPRGWQLISSGLDHLRNGVFADVEQGLTVRHAELLPARP